MSQLCHAKFTLRQSNIVRCVPLQKIQTMTAHRHGRAWSTQHVTHELTMQDRRHWPDRLDAGQQQAAGEHVGSRPEWPTSYMWHPQAPPHTACMPALHGTHGSVLQPVMSEQQDAVAYSPVQHGYLSPDWGMQVLPQHVAAPHWGSGTPWDHGDPGTQPTPRHAPVMSFNQPLHGRGPAVDFGQPGEPFRPVAPIMPAAGQASASVPMADMHRSWQHVAEQVNPQQAWSAGQTWQSARHGMPQVPPAMACGSLSDPMGVPWHAQSISPSQHLSGRALDW
jgi:hypothetical protein